MGKWISVNDKLPEPDIKRKYLVAVLNKMGFQTYNIGTYDEKGWHSGGAASSITHWMELPELPEVRK